MIAGKKDSVNSQMTTLFHVSVFCFRRKKKHVFCCRKRNSLWHLDENCTLVITGRKKVSNEMWTGAIFLVLLSYIGV